MAGYLAVQYLYLAWAVVQSGGRANAVIDDVICACCGIGRNVSQSDCSWAGLGCLL